jgi:Tol biopolymer transport system component
MLRATTVLFFVAVCLIKASQAHEPTRKDEFLVRDLHSRLVVLNVNGEVLEQVEASSSIGAFSPNGELLAYWTPPNGPSHLVIRSQSNSEQRLTVPLIWGRSGTSCQLLWSADSRSLLISEGGPSRGGIQQKRLRVYDLERNTLVELHISDEYWLNDWSAVEQRFLTAVNGVDKATRLAWINIDRTGVPEFITSEDEIAFGGKLSPDGRRILCRIAPKSPDEAHAPARLCVIDLATLGRTFVDEPGITHGYCWSPDGLKFAYTWQKLLEDPTQVPEREAHLITCDLDGGDRKVITTRTYTVSPDRLRESGNTIIFSVLSWR